MYCCPDCRGPVHWWGAWLRCAGCGRELWAPIKAIREIQGHYVRFTESQNPNHILERRRLFILEKDPIIGRGWWKEGKKVPKVFVAGRR
jgi:hypothetical protein